MKWNGTAVSKIHAVINGNKKSKLLLLTATPFQNNKFELQQLLSMLESAGTKNNANNITALIFKGTTRFSDKIVGVLGCFDRIIIKGLYLVYVTLMPWQDI